MISLPMISSGLVKVVTALTATPKNRGVAKTVANVPPVFAGMDKAEALAYVCLLYTSDAADE